MNCLQSVNAEKCFCCCCCRFFPKLLHCDFYQKEKAPKWQNEENLMDGLTTNGILLMNPKGGPSCQPTIWREISVCGNVYGLRRTRSTTEKGKTVSFRSLFIVMVVSVLANQHQKIKRLMWCYLITCRLHVYTRQEFIAVSIVQGVCSIVTLWPTHLPPLQRQTVI